MTKIYMVRHGQSVFNVERRIQGQLETELTDEGEKQALALGESLRSVEFSAVYSSPQQRARRTTELILEKWSRGKNLTLEPRYDDRLKEIMMGEWQGYLVDDLKRSYPEEMDIFWHRPELFSNPTCETYLQVRMRAAKCLEEIVESHPHQVVLVVTHGALMKTVYTYFKYQSIHEIANAVHPHSTGLCVVEKKYGVWNVLKWDDCEHLKGLE